MQDYARSLVKGGSELLSDISSDALHAPCNLKRSASHWHFVVTRLGQALHFVTAAEDALIAGPQQS
jgi:hypothetical protein